MAGKALRSADGSRLEYKDTEVACGNCVLHLITKWPRPQSTDTVRALMTERSRIPVR